MTEVWKKIPGFSRYEVSDLGNIRKSVLSKNDKKKVGELIKPSLDNYGYYICQLKTDDNEWYNVTFHKAVARSFMGEPVGDKNEVNHIDGNKRNNRLRNLEYVSSLENHRHASEMGLKARGSRNASVKLKDNEVIEIRRRYVRGKVSCATLGKEFGVSGRLVNDIINGKIWQWL